MDIIKRLDVKVKIITREDIDKDNKQYNNLIVKYDNNFHDRYFILDNEVLYHCGASINRIGYKNFSITLVNDREISDLLMRNIANI